MVVFSALPVHEEMPGVGCNWILLYKTGSNYFVFGWMKDFLPLRKHF